MKTRLALTLVAALTLACLAAPAYAIYQSDCPQKCTPSCPCSIVCQGPFGPTTCGQAGQACTGLVETETHDTLMATNMSSPSADADQVFLLGLQATTDEAPAATVEAPAAD